MSLPTDFFADAHSVVLDLEVGSGVAAVEALHQRLVTDNDAVRNAPQFLADVRARMLLAPVCLSGELALPHARTDAVSKMVVGIARTVGPLAFDAEHPSVRFIFLIGTPKAAVTEYLQAVAALSRFFRNPAARDRLLAAVDEAEFRAVFAGSAAALR